MRYSQLVPVWLLCLADGVASLFMCRYRRLSIGSAAPIKLWLPIALVTFTACSSCTGSHGTASQTVRSQGTAFQNADPENFETRFPFHQQTTYFDFRLQSESPQNAQTVRLSDNFVVILKRDFFHADRGYPIRVFICQDEGKFVQFMHRDLEIQDPSDYGIYLFSKKLLATYEDSGLGTFAHEALHPLVEFQRMGYQTRMNPNCAWRRYFYGSKVSSGGFSGWLQPVIDSDIPRILRLPWECPWGKSRQFGIATLKA